MSELLVEQIGAVAVLTLNRPERMNALNSELVVALRDAVVAASADRSVRAILLQGAGAGFCAGADLSPEQNLNGSGTALAETMRNNLNPLIEAIATAAKPVVVAVHGSAAGAGVGIALAADHLIMSDQAKLVIPFAQLGIALDGGCSWFLARQLGPRLAWQVAASGVPITAERALALHLAADCCPAEQLAAQGLAVAQRYASGATLALAAIKQQLLAVQTQSLSEALAAEAHYQGQLIESADTAEALLAFREKRLPSYRGC